MTMILKYELKVLLRRDRDVYPFQTKDYNNR